MINTTNIETNSGNGNENFISPVLKPGNQVIKINYIKYEKFEFQDDAHNLMLYCEGPELQNGFEGWMIDKNRPELGKASGQVGRVRATKWPLVEGLDSNGVNHDKNSEILSLIKHLCDATGSQKWLISQNEKHETVLDLLNAFINDEPFKDKWLRACLATKKYYNKDGYLNDDLYIPGFVVSKKTNDLLYTPLELQETSDENSKIIEFDTKYHEYIPQKKQEKEVNSFKPGQGNADDLLNVDLG